MSTFVSNPPAAAGTPLRVGLWVAQVLIAVAFCGAGLTKFFTPIRS
jgi:hypothetical protein